MNAAAASLAAFAALDVRSQLQQIVDHTSAAVFVKDLDGCYLFVNREFEHLKGVSSDAIIGRKDGELFPSAAAELRRNDLRVVDERRAIDFEETLETPQGTQVLLSHKFPLFDATGRAYAVCGVARDITARKRSEDALRAAALAVSSAEGDRVFGELCGYLAEILAVDVAMIAEYTDASRTRMRTLAACLDGKALRNFEYALEGSPCRHVTGRAFRFVGEGVQPEFPPGTLFAVKGIDSYAALPLNDSAGEPLGLIAAMDRQPMRDSALAEAMLKIFATRAASEIERLRALAALRDSEASYRAIFDASEDPIFVHDWDSGAILDVSPKAEAVYGHSVEALRRMRVADLSANEPPYTAAEARQWLDKAKSGPVRVEWRARHRDGHLMWHEVRLKPATIAGQRRIVAFVRDITASRAAEDALRASEEQYRAIFNASADALVLWNSRLERVDVNPAYERMFGFSREEALAGAPTRDLPAEDVERRKEIVARTLAGERCQEEVETVRRNGERFQAEVRTIPIQHRGEMHVLAMVRDITRRRRAEQALRESEARLRASEQRYRLLFEMESDAILVTDAQTLDLLDANRAAEELWGYSRDELMRMKATDLSAEKEATRAALQGDAGTIAVPIRRHRKQDGTEFPVEITLSRFVLDGRRIVLSAIRDITGRQAEERPRGELQAQLRQAQKMEAIGHLTGGIAHDFNNLLTSIMGYVTLAAERSAGGDAKLAGYLEQAELGCGRARDLIQQMLTFSRGGRGEPRALSLAPLVRESVKLLRSSLPTTVALHIAVDEDASPVLLDPVQIEQVLMNLAINARDAMHSSGDIRIGVRGPERVDAVCASCRAKIAGELVELAVADNGSGISFEVQERMFEPFFTTKDAGHGSGMGLATVHGIVHEHGGHIVVESAPGAGATFRVLLPALHSDARVPAQSLRAAAGRRLPSAKLAGRIAVVDDEASVACFMQDLLAHWGLAVTTFASGREALAALDASAAFDLVITDQTMPGMTGIEFARAAHALRPGLPVALYTGYGDTIAPSELERAGIVALVRKPVVPTDLLALVASRLPRADERSAKP